MICDTADEVTVELFESYLKGIVNLFPCNS